MDRFSLTSTFNAWVEDMVGEQIELHVSKSQLLSSILNKQLFDNVTSGADEAMIQQAVRDVILADYNTAVTGKGGLVADYVEANVDRIVHTNSNTATLASALSDLDASIRKLQQQEQQLLQQGQTMNDNDPDRIELEGRLLEVSELIEAQTESKSDTSETKKRHNDPVKRKIWEKGHEKYLNEQERSLEGK